MKQGDGSEGTPFFKLFAGSGVHYIYCLYIVFYALNMS